MKKIFTFAIALMSLFALLQPASALTYNVTVPAGTYVCYIAGNFPAPMNWAPTAAGAQMTKVDDTHYTITLDNADATMEYKYLSGPDWAYNEVGADGNNLPGDGNRKYVAGTPDVVAKWASLYNPNIPPLPLNVTIDVTVPAGTNQCYIVGTFNNWAGPTAPTDSILMTNVNVNADGTIVFEKTIYTSDANKLAYHFCSGPDWMFEQNPSTSFNYPEVQPTVTAWKAVYNPATMGTISVTATVPAGTTAVWVMYAADIISGDFTKAVACTKNVDGTFSFSAPFATNIEYKMYNQADADHPEVIAANRTATYPTNATANITVAAWAAAPSAVPELNADKYKVYTFNNTIVVEGVTSQVAIFDVSGRKIQSAKLAGKFSSKALNSGLYILLVDGATKKVAVN